MSDSMDERRKAMEEEYFRKRNQEALERLGQRESEKPRLSPITGEPMEQLTIMGVVVDRCPTSKGIWLDSGELEQILNEAKSSEHQDSEGMASRFFAAIFNTK